MTLPNRSGYVVEDSQGQATYVGDQLLQQQHLQPYHPPPPSYPLLTSDGLENLVNGGFNPETGFPLLPPILPGVDSAPMEFLAPPDSLMHHEPNLALQSVSFPPPPPIAGPSTSRTLKYAHHKLPKSQRQQPQPKLDNNNKRDPAVKHKDSPPQHLHQSVHLQPPSEPVPTEPEREYTKEEIQAKRHAVANHQLLQHFSNFMKQCKDDGIIPHVQELAEGDAAFLLTADFGLEEFFKSQGVDTTLLDERHHIPQQVNDRKEFVAKLEQLQKYYKEELDKLDRICEEFCLQLSNVIKNELPFRPVLDREMQLKVLGTRRKFDYVKNQVRQNVCHAIVQLQRRYNQERLVKRTLSKEATLALNEWFFEHLHGQFAVKIGIRYAD